MYNLKGSLSLNKRLWTKSIIGSLRVSFYRIDLKKVFQLAVVQAQAVLSVSSLPDVCPSAIFLDLIEDGDVLWTLDEEAFGRRFRHQDEELEHLLVLAEHQLLQRGRDDRRDGAEAAVRDTTSDDAIMAIPKRRR